MSSLLSYIQRCNPSQLHRLAPSSSLSTLHKVESPSRLLRTSRYQELQRYPLLGFSKIVFVEKPLTCPKTEVGKMHALGIIGEIDAADTGLGKRSDRRPRSEKRNSWRVPFPPSSARVSRLSLPGRTRAGEVRNVVLRRIDDAVLLMQIDHRRLDIGVAQHGLDLPNRGPMVQGQGGRRMAQRMGRNRPDRVRLGIEEPREARLLQMRPHHGLNRADA